MPDLAGNDGHALVGAIIVNSGDPQSTSSVARIPNPEPQRRVRNQDRLVALNAIAELSRAIELTTLIAIAE